MIESNSQIAPTLAIVISGFSESLRDQQMDNWSQTMGNVIQQLGGVKMESGVYYEHYNNTPFWTEFEPIENNPKSIGTPVVKNLCGNWKELPAMTGSK
jgi:hypothetical protein